MAFQGDFYLNIFFFYFFVFFTTFLPAVCLFCDIDHYNGICGDEFKEQFKSFFMQIDVNGHGQIKKTM